MMTSKRQEWTSNIRGLRKHPNDEFYSTPEFVEDFFDKLFADPRVKPMLKGSIVCCPCDTDESEFPKWLRAHQEELGIKEVWNFVDYYNSKVLEADFIITNPPFHGLNDWLKWLCYKGKKWAVVKGSVTPWIFGLVFYKDPPEISYWKAGRWMFNRPEGIAPSSVDVCYISNFSNYEFAKEEPTRLTINTDPEYHPAVYEIKEGSMASRMFDAPVYFIENPKKNGVPPDAKFVALPTLFEMNHIEGWVRVALSGGFSTNMMVNGKHPFSRIVWMKEPDSFARLVYGGGTPQ